MTKPYLEPFRAEHLISLVPRDASKWKWALEKEHGGPAFTACVHEKIIACAGVCVVWEGVGFAWAIITPAVRPHKLWLTRIVKSVLYDTVRAFKLHRVEAVALCTAYDANKWLRILGFNRETCGIADQYTEGRESVTRYELLADDIT